MRTMLVLPDGTATTMESIGSTQLETYKRYLEDLLLSEMPDEMKQRILSEWLTHTYQTVRSYLHDTEFFQSNRTSSNTHFMKAMDTLRRRTQDATESR